MSKRMLRSVLVAAFSAVVAFGTLSGLSVEKGDARADSAWSLAAVTASPAGEEAAAVTDDSAWS
ncbi:hypothetical protein ACFWQ6_25910 [Streptomyces coelicoflavus]|nr:MULTISPECIES: hypothetical protein [unclassified Streptomyces]MCV2461301.1 hypothetical protein [Streptomyces sp. ICN988]MCX5036472.1 hypothetical protein [Streptomyces coelicoflavus]